MTVWSLKPQYGVFQFLHFLHLNRPTKAGTLTRLCTSFARALDASILTQSWVSDFGTVIFICSCLAIRHTLSRLCHGWRVMMKALKQTFLFKMPCCHALYWTLPTGNWSSRTSGCACCSFCCKNVEWYNGPNHLKAKVHSDLIRLHFLSFLRLKF